MCTAKSWNCALHSRVSCESNGTRTHWFVINGLTEGIDAARADARISAFLREAGLVTRTIRINNALGIDANRNAISHSALAVIIAGRWAARIGF